MRYRYLYLGDALTRPELKGQPCNPVRRADGRCIVSTRMASALVEFADGQRCVVKRRRLRLIEKLRSLDRHNLLDRQSLLDTLQSSGSFR